MAHTAAHTDPCKYVIAIPTAFTATARGFVLFRLPKAIGSIGRVAMQES